MNKNSRDSRVGVKISKLPRPGVGIWRAGNGITYKSEKGFIFSIGFSAVLSGIGDSEAGHEVAPGLLVTDGSVSRVRVDCESCNKLHM